MVNVCGEAMVNAHELNDRHVCEEAMDVKKLCIMNVCGEAMVNAHAMHVCEEAMDGECM